MTDLRKFIRKYSLTPENLLLVQSLLKSVEWQKHGWSTDHGKTVKYVPNDIDIGYLKNGEMDWFLPFVQDSCLEYSQHFGNAETKTNGTSFITKISYPCRFNRYEPGGEMTPHYDFVRYIFDGNNKGIPIFSIILLLNDNFEGGELIFNLGTDEIYKPEVKAGDMLIFPSGFLFEHWVTPVTSGIRYSLVHWAY